uniref:CHCH domain-containing protein n=1 Tax=Chenopodium quinoa TaxID=63459 RepID=A0A803LIH4_CHEQI
MASKIESPPYPSAAKISDSSCFPQYTASLKCLEQNNSEKSKCQEFFDDYKECKKKEDFESSLPKLQAPQAQSQAQACHKHQAVMVLC